MIESQICIYRSPFLSVLNLFCFEFCSFDFSPTAFMTSEHKYQHLSGQYMDSHRVFLQNMISVLHSLFSSLFLPQDIRRYSYHYVHWTLLLFAVLLSFSGLPSLNFFKDLLFGQISWTCSFFATIPVFVPFLTSCVLSYLFHVCFYSTWTNTQKETCNVFHIFSYFLLWFTNSFIIPCTSLITST